MIFHRSGKCYFLPLLFGMLGTFFSLSSASRSSEEANPSTNEKLNNTVKCTTGSKISTLMFSMCWGALFLGWYCCSSIFNIFHQYNATAAHTRDLQCRCRRFTLMAFDREIFLLMPEYSRLGWYRLESII